METSSKTVQNPDADRLAEACDRLHVQVRPLPLCEGPYRCFAEPIALPGKRAACRLTGLVFSSAAFALLLALVAYGWLS